MDKKTKTSISLSAITKKELKALIKKTGENQSQLIARAIAELFLRLK